MEERGGGGCGVDLGCWSQELVQRRLGFDRRRGVLVLRTEESGSS
jgi:hypothetical protein